MTRKGKIARLPHSLRQQINQRLQNGEEGKHIADWLNTVPEAKAVLDAEFGGEPINEVNLSNWKLGGYRDWEAQQVALAAVHSLGEDAAELAQAAGGQLADQLATCLSARIAVALQQSVAETHDPADQLKLLRELCADLVALRKGDHNAQWLRMEREKLDLELKKQAELEAARQKEIEELKNPKKNCLTKETIELIEKELKLL